MLTVNVPGKLYIAGEYAVTHLNQPAIIVAVNRFITVTIESARNHGTVYSKHYTPNPLPISRENGTITIDETLNLIEKTLQIVETYLKERHIPIQAYHLNIDSDLELNHKKIGLGSSGAVTVAIVKAILNYHNVSFSPNLIYKLATLTHLSLDSHGSFGDIAACSYTGCICYCSFDQEHVQKIYQTSHSVLTTVNAPWPGLTITPLTFPSECSLLVGWTNQPASTEQLVKKSRAHALTSQQLHTFLSDSKTCVNQVLSSIQGCNIPKLKQAISTNRSILQTFATNKGIIIETPLLKELCTIAENYTEAAKTSGAGGGDCGIAIVSDPTHINGIITTWKQAGITPIDLAIYTELE